jgi:putative ATP-dependent endonuclease of OLD family
LDKKSTKPPFDRLIEDPFFKSIRELLRSTVNLSLEIKKDPNTMQFNFYFVQGKNPYPVDMAALSAGEKSIIHFIFTIYGYDLKDGVMIIDEPESHIHPQIQKKLLKIIMKTMIDFNMQYIIVTHSAILVDFTTIRYSFRFHRDSNSHTKVVHPPINEQDSTLIRFLTYTKSSKLFFANKILLVEGSSDEYFYRVFLNELESKGSNNEDIEILNIQGKSDFSAWRKFLDKFEIPNYYIGDLDNVFNTSFSIISNQDKCTIENHLITNSSAIRQNTINDPNYKNKRDFKKALVRHVNVNLAQFLK